MKIFFVIQIDKQNCFYKFEEFKLILLLTYPFHFGEEKKKKKKGMNLIENKIFVIKKINFLLSKLFHKK